MSDPSDEFALDDDAALRRRMAAAATSWRREVDGQLPQPDAFLARMQRRLAGADAATSADGAAPQTAAPARASSVPISPAPSQTPAQTKWTPAMWANTQKGRPPMSTPTEPMPTEFISPQPRLPVAPTPPRRRFASVATGATAALILALLVSALAYTFAARQNRPGATGHTGTATALPTYTPTTVPTAVPTPIYDGGPFVLAAIAPSDPQVIYEVNSTGDTITRSADGGASFSKTALPHSTTVLYPNITIAVSPLDANHVFATDTGLCLSGANQASNQAQLTAPLSSGPNCSQSFFSADGGQSWRALTLPFPGAISSEVSWYISLSVLNFTNDMAQAQGSRLYAAVGLSDGAFFFAGSARLIVSNDGGATWQPANYGLGANMCDFAPAPTGETIYAITAPSGCSIYGSLSTLILWRSDNAGASWTQVRTLPTPNNLGMLVTPNGDLYINLPVSTPTQPHIAITPDALIVSHDGGQTFTRSPLAGAPAAASFSGPAGVLSDGSILAVSFDTSGQGSMTFYAWRAGQSSWRQVGPTYVRYVMDVVVSTNNGTDVVYLADAYGQIVHFTV